MSPPNYWPTQLVNADDTANRARDLIEAGNATILWPHRPQVSNYHLAFAAFLGALGPSNRVLPLPLIDVQALDARTRANYAAMLCRLIPSLSAIPPSMSEIRALVVSSPIFDHVALSKEFVSAIDRARAATKAASMRNLWDMAFEFAAALEWQDLWDAPVDVIVVGPDRYPFFLELKGAADNLCDQGTIDVSPEIVCIDGAPSDHDQDDPVMGYIGLDSAAKDIRGNAARWRRHPHSAGVVIEEVAHLANYTAVCMNLSAQGVADWIRTDARDPEALVPHLIELYSRISNEIQDAHQSGSQLLEKSRVVPSVEHRPNAIQAAALGRVFGHGKSNQDKRHALECLHVLLKPQHGSGLVLGRIAEYLPHWGPPASRKSIISKRLADLVQAGLIEKTKDRRYQAVGNPIHIVVDETVAQNAGKGD